MAPASPYRLEVCAYDAASAVIAAYAGAHRIELCADPAAGEEGVVKMLGILRKEFEMAMALSGRAKISEINRDVLWKE